jgi:hypothetical protein
MGRSAKANIAIQPAGAGAAYASNVVPNIHTFMRLAGHLATLDATADAESWTYTPHAVLAEESGTLEVYERKQKYPLAGVYAELTADFDVPGIPKFTFACQGLMSALPSDSSVPNIVYPTVEPPKAEGVNFTAEIDGTTFTVGKLKKLQLLYARNITARAHDNTTPKHGGFNVGVERTITLNAMIEAEALTAGAPYLAAAGFNIFQLMERADAMALAFGWGTAQYNRFAFAAANAQLVDAPEEDEGGVASMWNCTWECKPSTLTANDEYSLTAD